MKTLKMAMAVKSILCGFALVQSATWYATDPKIDGHDPTILRTEKGYVLQTTNNLLSTRTSKDLIHWTTKNRALNAVPAWLLAIGAVENIWAPDLAYFNNKYWSYYTGSVFGKNTSGLGVVSTQNLDVDAATYSWTDLGEVHRSKASDNYNAIDADIVQDENGIPWMSFGSWWQGIRLVKLDSTTGKKADTQVYSIANRGGSGIEGPSILRRDGYYYLFTSWDVCCSFNPVSATTYNTRVGRATKITGPYVDRAGKSLMEGGGTLMLSRYYRYYGPGGGSAFWDVNRARFVNHYYDTLRANNPPTLQIRDLVFSEDGWPEMGQPFLGRYMSAEAEHGVLTNVTISGSATASNGEYVAYINESNSKVRLPMFIPHGGEYLLRYRYANGGAAATHMVSVNGAAAQTIALPATTGWGTFPQGGEFYFKVQLKKGGNFVEVTKGTAFAELDRIDFLRLADTLPASGFDQGYLHGLSKNSFLLLKNEGWALYENMVYDSIQGTKTKIQVRSCQGGVLNLRSDGPSETPFGNCTIPASCPADSWTTVECTATRPTGIHDLYLTLSNAGANALEIGDLRFENATTGVLAPSAKPSLPMQNISKRFDLKGRSQ